MALENVEVPKTRKLQPCLVSLNRYPLTSTLDGRPIIELDIFEVYRSVIKVCGRQPKVLLQGGWEPTY